jgi:hypothetical protein
MAALFYLVLTFILVRLFRWFEDNRMGDQIGLEIEKDDDRRRSGCPPSSVKIERR